MNGMFKNSRGLRDLAKHLHIADCIREHALDFIAISETGKRDYSASLLNRFSGGEDFAWVSRLPHGRSGGLLIGVRASTMEILDKSDGEFHIKLHIRNKSDNFIWSLVSVYGAAQEELKPAFLRELVNLAKDNPYPIIIGGDFNLLRYPHEKSRGRFDNHWPFLFNAVIDSLDLREVTMVGRQFTWANSLSEPTYEKLDRVLMDSDWEQKYPMVSSRALPRIAALSDHAPILLSTGSSIPPRKRPFKFELGWIQRDGFSDMVKRIWDNSVTGSSPIQRWSNKLRSLRTHLSGWARHQAGLLKKEKLRLSSVIDDLEAIAESRLLTPHEIELKSKSNAELAGLLREEELKWYQRSKAQFLLEGDANTRYFHSVANGRHRKKLIHSLVQEEGTIEGHEQLKSYITSYYKKLFGAPEECTISLDESRIADIPQVTPEENNFLTAPYSEEEVRKAVFMMEHNKAPGPDGFPAEFYQSFWDVIKEDLLPLFADLSAGHLDLFRLNFGEIILLPKINDAERIQQYRPICLLNVCFKIFTKVVTIRLNSMADHVVRPTQTAFMQGRYILDGVVTLHETVHELHRKKLNGVILKIDFEKAYDKVKWDFLLQVLRMKGFAEEWRTLILNSISGGSVAIKVNDDIGGYFQTKKGLRQGDPLSPMLFNIVADMLAIFIDRAKADGQIEGVVPHLVDGGLSILQYADDTILFMEHDLDKARNLKLILSAFELLSGLKINFHKSELFCFGEAVDDADLYAELFGCGLGSFPISYLGIPIHHRRLTNAEWKHVEVRIQKRLSSWKGKLLSLGGRLVLINSVLTNMVLYMVSFFQLPKGILHRLDYYRSRFFWQGDSEKRKYRLTKWNIVCRPKDQGGLGVHDLEVKNRALLGKWLARLLTEDGVWQSILRKKYVGSKAISQVFWKPGDSHFWAGLMSTKKHFFPHGSFNIRDGSEIRFWEDKWLGHSSLRDQYPALYQIVRNKDDTLAKVLEFFPPILNFRRHLAGPRLSSWTDLLQRLASVQLTPGTDEFMWNLTKTGAFTVDSMYRALIQSVEPVLNNKLIWKMKIPLKTKVFTWYLRRGVILTKDNLAKRNWHGSKKCVFCNQDETIKHLFFNCHFARSIWSIIQIGSTLYPPRSVANIFGNWLNGVDCRFKTLIRVGAIAVIWSLWLCRNDKVFNNNNSTLMQVLYRCTALLRLWSSLQRLQDRDLFMEVSTRLEGTARELFTRHGWRHSLRIAPS
jgi:hypothetical protein